MDTPSNIESQTFLSRDTETPVATNQPQWHKKLPLQCIYFRGSVSGQKNARKIAAYCSHVMIIQFVVGEVIQIYTVL